MYLMRFTAVADLFCLFKEGHSSCTFVLELNGAENRVIHNTNVRVVATRWVMYGS